MLVVRRLGGLEGSRAGSERGAVGRGRPLAEFLGVGPRRGPLRCVSVSATLAGRVCSGGLQREPRCGLEASAGRACSGNAPIVDSNYAAFPPPPGQCVIWKHR